MSDNSESTHYGLTVSPAYGDIVLLPMWIVNHLDEICFLGGNTYDSKGLSFSNVRPKFELIDLREIKPATPDPAIAKATIDARKKKPQEELEALDAQLSSLD